MDLCHVICSRSKVPADTRVDNETQPPQITSLLREAEHLLLPNFVLYLGRI